jgi:signal transduction histidine kinase
MPKIAFLWDEEKTRSLFRTHLILFLVGGVLALFYTLILPPSTPYRLVIVAIPLLFTLSCLFYLLTLHRPNPGPRFLIFALEGQLAAAIFMALTGGFLGIVQFAPYMFLLFALFELGGNATVLLGIFSILTFIGIFIWSFFFKPEANLLQSFFYYVGSYTLILIVERNIGKELSLQFEARKRLEQVDDLKNQFITLASHYLRTPLTLIKGSASSLERENLGPAEMEKLRHIDTSVKQLELLVEKLLTLSSIEKGQAKVTPIRGDLCLLLRNLLIEFQPLAKEHQIGISFESSFQGMPAMFDPTQFKDAISILIDNAIKYNKQGGGVTISLTEDAKKIYISVADTGIGLKKEQLADLFSTFNRGSLERALQMDKPGLGLSLYIAKLIIEAHLGSISVESQEGIGSKFTVTMPRT